MVERRELITVCRQIGTMMEVGVDFLRITKALREQTENPRLIELYDQLDHEMRMGESLADAISKAPDVFSPFAVSLVRQGEARGDIEGAWHRLADFLKQQAQEDKDLGFQEDIGSGYIPTRGLPSNGLEVVAPRAPVTVGMLSDLIDRVQTAVLRGLTWVASFLLTLAVVWWSVELGFIQSRWMVGIQLCVAAVFLGGAGSWLRIRLEKNRKKEAVCSFCGKTESDTVTLQRSSKLAGAAICQSCAAVVTGTGATETSVTGAGATGTVVSGNPVVNSVAAGNSKPEAEHLVNASAPQSAQTSKVTAPFIPPPQKVLPLESEEDWEPYTPEMAKLLESLPPVERGEIFAQNNGFTPSSSHEVVEDNELPEHLEVVEEGEVTKDETEQNEEQRFKI